MHELIKSVQVMVLENPARKSGRQICAEAFGVDENGNPNKPEFTLYRELNPNDNGAKLGLVTFAQLLPVCGDIRPLACLAAMAGHRLAPLRSGAPDGEDMRHECLQSFEAVAEYVKAANEGASHVALLVLLEKAIKELEDVAVRARDRDYAAAGGKL